MRGYPAALDHDVMDPVPARYMIRRRSDWT
jgi:hypothetical protein